MNILALDVGVKKIGVAIASTLVGQARPLGLLEVGADSLRQLLGVLKQWQIKKVVIGDPGDRRENSAVLKKIGQLKAQLKKFSDVVVDDWPEDYSSQEAQMEQQQHPDQSTDAIAAMLVLQAYLDANGASR